eukprot:gene530-biopygen9470
MTREFPGPNKQKRDSIGHRLAAVGAVLVVAGATAGGVLAVDGAVLVEAGAAVGGVLALAGAAVGVLTFRLATSLDLTQVPPETRITHALLDDDILYHIDREPRT